MTYTREQRLANGAAGEGPGVAGGGTPGTMGVRDQGCSGVKAAGLREVGELTCPGGGLADGKKDSNGFGSARTLGGQ